MNHPPKPQPYWSPYAAGLGLGLVLFLSYVLLGTGLGASGTFARVLYAVLHGISPESIETHSYMGRYFADGVGPLGNSIVYLTLGLLVGGFISGLLAGRIRRTVEKGPRISRGSRFALAFIGGSLMGFGARMAGGCTSGQALSGGATLALGSWAFMFAVFGGAFAVAFFVRRQWT